MIFGGILTAFQAPAHPADFVVYGADGVFLSKQPGGLPSRLLDELFRALSEAFRQSGQKAVLVQVGHGGDRLFRQGDKVMQIKNDYQIRWTKKTSLGDVYEEGTGVFNGDTGIIREIIPVAEQVVVEFEEGKMVEYEYSQMDEMELAYAITIHKSQGSEYPAIVLPVLGGPKMLLGPNLLYTAVTRAKKCVTTVGSSRVIQGMIHNVNEQKRFSSLCQRIKEMEEEDAELNH